LKIISARKPSKDSAKGAKNDKAQKQIQSIYFVEFQKYSIDEQGKPLVFPHPAPLENTMKIEGIQKFFSDLNASIENCESLIACYLLGFSSFLTINFSEFEQSLVKNNCTQVTQLSKIVKP
jgi:hypothetical protein